MSTIDEIMAKVFESQDAAEAYEAGGYVTAEQIDALNDALREMIAAALADARREGAEQMREAVAKLARKVPLHYGSGESADEELAQAIEDLPLPTGKRQAVLLTDEQR